MSRRAARCGLAAALVATLVLVVAGAASAAPELRLSPASGPPGSEFTVTGTGFEPAEVELHWESQSGPLLTTATGPDFTVSATVPDAPPNSHQVVAVVRVGNAVSTSNASFQVTPGTDQVEPTPATTTTVDEPATTPLPARSEPTLPSSTNGGRISGVDGGSDPPMADTVGDGVDGKAGGGPPAGAIVTVPSTPATGASGDGSTASLTVPPGAGGATNAGPSTLPSGAAGGAVPVAGGDDADAGGTTRAQDAGGTALGRTVDSQSSGAVRSPLLLIVGLGMVFGGGVVLAVRNRARP